MEEVSQFSIFGTQALQGSHIETFEQKQVRFDALCVLEAGEIKISRIEYEIGIKGKNFLI